MFKILKNSYDDFLALVTEAGACLSPHMTVLRKPPNLNIDQLKITCDPMNNPRFSGVRFLNIGYTQFPDSYAMYKVHSI
jgi:hypothetical protein